MKHSLGIAISLFAIVSCSSSSTGSGTTSSSSDITAICTQWVNCNAVSVPSVSACAQAFAGWVVPSGCVAASQALSCSALATSFGLNQNSSPTVPQACFPPCNVDKGKTICPTAQSASYCSNDGSVSWTYDCTAKCAAQSASGTCGLLSDGTTGCICK
ncbi:MAG: hypothetical protein ACHREM_02530 [Polyangiales bacterium]